MKSTEIDRCWSSGKLSGGVFRCRIPLLDTPVVSGKPTAVRLRRDGGVGRYPEPPVTWLAGRDGGAGRLGWTCRRRLGSWGGSAGWGHPESWIRRDGRRGWVVGVQVGWTYAFSYAFEFPYAFRGLQVICNPKRREGLQVICKPSVSD